MQSKLLLILCLQAICHASANFQEGEIVPTSRRGQYHGSRTVWHDLMGRHCPRFARNSKVVVPIPKPVGGETAHKGYKIQFAFSDRVLGPWVQIMGIGMVGPPVVSVQLEHMGDVLKSARAKVVPLNAEYLKDHQQVLREFQNATMWPKHLLVHYTWKHTNPINVNAGLYLVFLVGITMTAVLGLSAVVSYQDKLNTFVADMIADDAFNSNSSPTGGVSWQKAD